MTTLRKAMRSPVTTAVLFALALLLLGTSTIGGTRAALTFYSETYTSRVEMFDIGVSLVENGEKISWRDYGSSADGSWSEHTGALMATLPGGAKTVTPGVAYPEALSVTNSGTIPEFVRVTVYRYWVDEDGEKVLDVSPDLIDLHYVNLGRDWVVDEDASTDERTVLYYQRVLPSGESTVPLSDTLTLDPAALSYEDSGLRFQIEAVVNAVQTHNAEDAIRSAWGRQATVSGDALRLD